MDVLSLVVTNAMLLATSTYNVSQTPSIDWKAINETYWWGPSHLQNNQDTGIYSANITFKDDMIADLRKRLETTRYVDAPLEKVAFQYGFNPVNLANWTKYWATEYDFKAQEANFNKFPAYKTNIQGLDIFFLRIRPNVPKGTEIVPMLMVHGWPDTIRMFWEVIPLITAVSKDRDFAIELIVPCLPGAGWSDAPVRPGLGAAQVAILFHNLMNRLGYKRFYVQGGDFGALINGHMAVLFPDAVLGYHANWPTVFSSIAVLLQIVGQMYPPLVVPKETEDRLYPIQNKFSLLMTVTGYFHMHVTKPDTIGVALDDSPAALLAYVFEKYATANVKANINLVDGGLFGQYDPAYLIDVLMLYWSTHSTQSTIRLYAETFNYKHFGFRLEEIPTKVPTWFLQPSQDVTYQSPLILSLRYQNILNATVLPSGGHFLAHDLPEEFTVDVLNAVAAFRDWHAKNGTDTTLYF